jgi:hypothetical protein
VVGKYAALIWRKLAVWVYLILEALEELLASWASAGAAVACAAPRDLGADSAVDAVLTRHGLRSVLVSSFVSEALYARIVQTRARDVR